MDVHVGIPEVDDLLPEIRQLIHSRAAQVVEICNVPDAERIHDSTGLVDRDAVTNHFKHKGFHD